MAPIIEIRTHQARGKWVKFFEVPSEATRRKPTSSAPMRVSRIWAAPAHAGYIPGYSVSTTSGSRMSVVNLPGSQRRTKPSDHTC